MLSVSRIAVGNVRCVHPGVVRARKLISAGGFTQTFGSRRWISIKVNHGLLAKESDLIRRRRRSPTESKAESNDPCGCEDDEPDGPNSSTIITPFDENRRIPMMGELIQFPNDPSPYPAPPRRHVPINRFFQPKPVQTVPDPVLVSCEKCESNEDREVDVQEGTEQKAIASRGGPTCPPPPPPPPKQSYTGYILGAIALTAGGLGLAYYNGLFDGTPPPTPLDDTKEDPRRKKLTYPASSKDLPKHVPYLLIGGGTASIAAFRSIRGHDPKAKVMMITNELEMPYMRPPLSKELWFNPTETEPLKFRQWNGSERSIFYESNDYYIDPSKLSDAPNGGVAVARGYEVHRLDVANRKAILTDGTEITYDKCLIATGARPKNLPIFESAPRDVRERVTLFKSVHDFEQLSSKLGDGCRVAIVGGGFLGSELACALSKSEQTRKKKVEVFQLFHEGGNMAKILPEYLSSWTTERLREEGVKVWPKTQVKAVEMQGSKLKLTLMDDSVLLVDRVIVAVGSEPNTDLAKTSGLEVDNQNGGFLVDAELRARSNVFVAGDAACFYDTKFGRRRVEHHDHAIVSGRLAGENMVGLNKPYTHQSMFWSDLGPRISYEAIGLIDSALPTVAVFAKRTAEEMSRAVAAVTGGGNDSEKLQAANANVSVDVKAVSVAGAEQRQVEPAKEQSKGQQEPEDSFDKGVIFYLREKKVVGLVLWNVFNRMGTARKILDQHTEYDDLNEVAKLFNLHERPAEDAEIEAE
ncbi:apoptosis-inducing factor 1, mitochondrial [Anopheles marshallii]|uniref:apoptosis-inducing factor 1, mitochondrial n=1 Tax=Anopheles marshallii TaxID=1521116 RepID=UPI00237BADFD|nr:apoptosis-inducing factor 1, mitochondrial [Anopheles marshallii]